MEDVVARWLTEDDLNNRSAKHASKSMLVARGADTQLGSSCVSEPLATNVDLWNPITRKYNYVIHLPSWIHAIETICYNLYYVGEMVIFKLLWNLLRCFYTGGTEHFKIMV